MQANGQTRGRTKSHTCSSCQRRKIFEDWNLGLTPAPFLCHTSVPGVGHAHPCLLWLRHGGRLTRPLRRRCRMCSTGHRHTWWSHNLVAEQPHNTQRQTDRQTQLDKRPRQSERQTQRQRETQRKRQRQRKTERGERDRKRQRETERGERDRDMKKDRDRKR